MIKTSAWNASTETGIIPFLSQVTLSSNTPHGAPLERGNLDTSCSIDIALRWSENQTTKEHFSRLVIERKRSVTC